MFIEKPITQNLKARPFVKWAGGKSQLINEISKLIPFSTDDEFLYVEPFVGGGAVLFWLLENYPKAKAIINDINQELINAYKAIKHHLDQLLEILCKLDNEFNSLPFNSEARKIFYYKMRQEFNNKQISPLKRAALFIFLNKTCFNGLYRVNAKGEFNVPIGRYKTPKICDKENLIAVHKALQKVSILQGDFEQTIKFASPQTLYYLDPPYRPISKTASFTSYTNEGFDDNDQLRLKSFCDKLTNLGAKWILSNSDPKNIDPHDNFFENLYAKYNLSRISAKRFINSKADRRGNINEIIITNF